MKINWQSVREKVLVGLILYAIIALIREFSPNNYDIIDWVRLILALVIGFLICYWAWIFGKNGDWGFSIFVLVFLIPMSVSLLGPKHIDDYVFIDDLVHYVFPIVVTFAFLILSLLKGLTRRKWVSFWLWMAVMATLLWFLRAPYVIECTSWLQDTHYLPERCPSWYVQFWR